jgi:RHS repeat-associated protein
VNEITNITESTGPTWIVPAYDPAGNMTTLPQVVNPTQSFTAVYDAWNRMVSVSDGATLVATYRYDGRHFRIMKTVIATSVDRHYYYTSTWQEIEQRVGSGMDQQHVWGVRYIDELVCRDDATPLRLYATQDANFNVTALAGTTGTVQQYFVYDPYGTDSVYDRNWSVTSDAYNWASRFTGRQYESETANYSYRMRYYSPRLGRFVTRDSLGYADGASLVEYVRSNPLARRDPTGFGCTVTFQCSLTGSVPVGDCDTQCSYQCRETERSDSLLSGLNCDAIPQHAIITDGELASGNFLCSFTKGLCGSRGTCKPSYQTSRVYTDLDQIDRSCSRASCVLDCSSIQRVAQAAISRLSGPARAIANAAISQAYSDCAAGCNAWCRNP